MSRIKGQIISGNFSAIKVRQKSGEHIEIGELLIAETAGEKLLFVVFDLAYGSQISEQNREMIAGMALEEDTALELFDANLRNYMIACLKSLVTIGSQKVYVTKKLPDFFSNVMEIQKTDLSFLTRPKNPLFLGYLRSGSKKLDVEVFIDGEKALSHHVLISGTTGKGKSVLVSNMLWDLLDKEYGTALVFDPHDEYYGRTGFGLQKHPRKEKVIYYTSRMPPPGTRTLAINLQLLRPHHFDGVIDFSDAQKQALNLFFREFGVTWIESIILEKKLNMANFRDDTIAVVKRRLLQTLDLNFANNQLSCHGIFKLNAGLTTITDMASALEDGNMVIIDTSHFSGTTELLIASLVGHDIFARYKNRKISGSLDNKPVISMVLEEAPRVLGKEALERGPNIFSTIAREGRKFKVGLLAITQLPSLIPREILANMNTKIILGTEMKPERQAIIDSAAQDLSTDDRTIASLDVGEALITSNFITFATPIKVPYFEQRAKEYISHNSSPANQTIGFSELK